MTTEQALPDYIAQKFNMIVSGYGINADDALWLFGALSQPQAAPAEDVFSMDVINRAGILASDMPHTVVEKLREASVAEPRSDQAAPRAEPVESKEIERCKCGYPMPCALTVPIGFCKAGIVGNEEQR